MNNPRENNRFRLARCVHNQHGKQSVATVTKNTKIAGSMIDDLEAVAGKPRGVSYLTVAALAKYYGVSVDYLCGLSDVVSPDADMQAVCKYTGLSETAVASLRKALAKSRTEHISLLLSSIELDDFLSILEDYTQQARVLTGALDEVETNEFIEKIFAYRQAYRCAKAARFEAVEKAAEIIDEAIKHKELIEKFEKQLDASFDEIVKAGGEWSKEDLVL